MRSRTFKAGLSIWACTVLALSPVLAEDVKPNAPPVIVHEPVTKAMKGQSLTMKARVTDDKGKVESVTLYYTLSKDAAPFKVALKPAGLDYYIGTIDAGVLAGVSTISYYIDAQDNWGATRETPWYLVTFREASPGEAVPAGNNNGTGTKVPAPNEPEAKSGAPVGLIVGGAVAVVGGALLVAGSGGGGGSSGGNPDDPAAKQGTYLGSVTTCLTLNGMPPSCESHECTIVIDSTGKVLSNDIRQDTQLTTTLSGSDFTFTADVSDEGQGITGEIFYNGTVVNDNKIVGSISGSQQGGAQGSGNYSGSFSATKQ